jgi:hypothetical protein
MIGRQPTANNREPARRVVLLGASNLVRSISTVVETARQIWREPVEIMAAIGHGRSYGRESTVLGRKISGIFPCTLWKDLQNRRPLPTTALVTDVGNDLGYGETPDRIINWVEQCLDRLDSVGATTVVTQLPVESLARVGERRFRLFRTLLFPSCKLSRGEVVSLANELNEKLIALGEVRKVSVISASGAWYGYDPIHLRRASWREAWPTILSAWCDDHSLSVAPRSSLARWAYLRCLAPSERAIFGFERRAAQPSGRLRDGTTISLY